MLSLTLRSSRDGRFLAKIVDRGDIPFVLDYGDRRVIDDAGQRLIHGFTMWRFDRLVTAHPTDDDMLHLLAEYYAGEGLLVFFEEPAWDGRVPDPDAPDDVPGGAPALGGFVVTPALGEIDEDDEPTEFVVDPADEPTEED